MEFSRRLPVAEHVMRVIWRHSLNAFTRADLVDFFDGAYSYTQIRKASEYLYQQGFLDKKGCSPVRYTVLLSCETFYLGVIETIKEPLDGGAALFSKSKPGAFYLQLD